MTEEQFIAAIRAAKASGKSEIFATLNFPVRGVKRVAIRNLDGAKNGCTSDIWIESRSGRKVIGRASIGSRRTYKTPSLEGWESAIASFED